MLKRTAIATHTHIDLIFVIIAGKIINNINQHITMTNILTA